MTEGSQMGASNLPAEGRFFMSIRLKMLIYFGLTSSLVLVGVLLVYLFGTPFPDFQGAKSRHQTKAFLKLSLIADLKKEVLQRWIERHSDDASVICQSRLVREQVGRLLFSDIRGTGAGGNGGPGEASILDHHLQRIKKTHGFYERILIVNDSSGTILAFAGDADALIDPGKRGLFPDVQTHTGDRRIGITKDTATGQFNFFISQVVELNYDPEKYGSARAVLFLEANTGKFIEPLLHEIADLGKTGEALLVGEGGELLVQLMHPLADGSRAQPLKYRISAKPAVLAARGEEGIIRDLDYRNEPVLAAYRHIRISNDMGWGLVVKSDENEVFRDISEIIRNLVFIALLGVTIICVLCLFFAEKLSRPIRQLSAAAGDLASGNLGTRAQVQADDEVGRLAAVFNAMAAEIQNWRTSLEEQVKNRTRALEAANQELEQFVYVASHDLRSPLVNVEGWSKELEMQIKELDALLKTLELPPESREKIREAMEDSLPEAFKFIKSSTSRMSGLITGLLLLARLGRQVLNITRVDVNVLVSETIKSFEYQLQTQGIKIQVGDLPPCRGDLVQLGQVFSNLIGNSIKYGSPSRPVEIGITGRIEGKTAEYFLEDNGIGIEKHNLPKIFELFHRLRPGETEGEGLGLTIVKKAVNRMDGSISVESEVGKGTVFKVVLPGVF